MNEEIYQGWSNRETWAAWVAISNTESWYLECLKLSELPNAPKSIHDFVDSYWFTLTLGRGENQKLYCSLLKAIGSLWRVDWKAIAETLQTHSRGK